MTLLDSQVNVGNERKRVFPMNSYVVTIGFPYGSSENNPSGYSQREVVVANVECGMDALDLAVKSLGTDERSYISSVSWKKVVILKSGCSPVK